jgi:DNA polymerase III epsilon subunit-like protein
MMSKKYIFLDTETGGLDTSYSLLTLYVGIFDHNLVQTGELDLRIKPNQGNYKVSEGAMKVNRIDLLKHETGAITEAEAAKQLEYLLSVASDQGSHKLIPVGHNLKFDLDFINTKLMNEKAWSKHCSKIVLDTTTIGMFLKVLEIIPSEVPNSLSSYAEYYGLPRKNLHDAKNDVLLNVQVFKKMVLGRLNLQNKR